MEYKVQSWFSKEFIFYAFKVACQRFVLSHLNLSAQNAVSLETKSNMNLKISNPVEKKKPSNMARLFQSSFLHCVRIIIPLKCQPP